jgi:photosystem II stability/assembly factor-like uncharacterized protein
MKNKHCLIYSFIIFLSLSFSFSVNSFSQGLNSISSPDGNFVIAAGEGGKIIYSTNSGIRWLISTAVVSNFKSVSSFGNKIWVSGSNGNIYNSLISPVNLIPYNTGNSGQMNGVCFANSATGYSCSSDGKIYKSINAGVNWLQQFSISQTLNSISFKDDMHGVCVGTSGTILETINGGISWQSVSSGTSKNLFKVKYFSSGYVVAGENGTLLTKFSSVASVDSKILTDIHGVSGTSLTDVHVCGGGGFIRNNRNGNSDFNNFEVNPELQNLVDIFYFDLNNGWAVSSLNDCVIRTTNGGLSWDNTGNVSVTSAWEIKLGPFTQNSHGSALSKHPYNPNEYFTAFENNVYITRDKGENWTLISTYPASIPIPPNGTFSNNFYVSRLDTNVWLSAIQSEPFDKIIRTTNYGANWTIVKDSITIGDFSNPLEEDVKTPGTYYLANDAGGFYKSENNGASFSQISSQSWDIPCDVVAMPDTNVIFIGNATYNFNDSGSVLKSTNGGINWSTPKKFNTSEIPFLSYTQFEKNTIYASILGYKLYKSTNLGNDWMPNAVTASPWALDVCEEDPTVIHYGKSDIQSFFSTNSGVSFNPVNYISGSFSLNSLIAPERGRIIGYFYRGIYKMKFTYDVTIDVKNISSNIPDRFSLSQNYPNPFNPNTNIKFAIPRSGFVKLKIFDAIGREVKNLVNENLSVGEYETNFDGSSLNSGIYFYKLETDNFTETKKMILVK